MPTTADYLAAQPNMTQLMSQATTYANSLFDRSNQMQAGAQYANGDYGGAGQTLARGGNIDDAAKVQAAGASSNSNGLSVLAKGTQVLQAAYDAHASQGPDAQKAAVLGVYKMIASEAKSTTNASDQLLTNIYTGLEADPQGTIKHLQSLVPPTYQKAGDDLLQFQGNNTNPSQIFQGTKYEKVGPSDQLYQTGGIGVGSAAQTPANAQPGAAPASSPGGADLFGGAVNPQAVAGIESRGNPGAVSPAGAVGTMQTMPGTLRDPGYGVQPAQDNSPAEQTRVGTDYIQAMTQKYGPVGGLVAYNMGPGATDKWIAGGMDFAKLPEETQKYIGRAAVEQARLATQGGQPPQAAPQQPAQAQGGPRLVAQGQPAFRDPTPDEQAKYPGVSVMKPDGPHYPPNAQTMGDPQLRASAAKAIANYQIPPPSAFTLRSQQGQALLAEVMKQNPDYQAQKYGQYQAGYKAFSTGKQGDTVRSLNVWVQHSQILQTAAKALDNGNIPLFNQASNLWKAQTGSPLPSNFDAVRNVYAEEATKAILGGAGALGDREEVRKTINSSQSPQALAGVANEYTNLAAGQLAGLKRQYQNATGRKDFETLLDPLTARTLEAHATAASQPLSPGRKLSPQQAAALKKYGLQ